MSEQAVAEAAGKLVENWSPLLSKFPRWRLDGTWPSIGTLDLLTFRLRNQTHDKLLDRELIDGCAAYLAGIASDIWRRFEDNIEVRLERDSNNGEVRITALGGKFLKRRSSYTVNVSAAIEAILNREYWTFPHFADHARKIAPNENIISPFALGLFSGLCPLGEGPWAELSPNDFSEQLRICEGFLAGTSARFYEDTFPSEPIGANPALYLHYLIFPPLLFNEPCLGARAAKGLSEFSTQHELKDSELRALALNLSSLRDPTLSAAGFAYSVALCDKRPSDTLIGTRHSLGTFAPLIRPAISLAREFCDKPRDMLHAISLNQLDVAKQYYDLELKLSLHPLLLLSFEEILSDRELGAALIVGNFPEARDRIAIKNLNYSDSPELFIQGLLLDLELDRIKALEGGLRALKDRPEADFLKALRALKERDYAQGLKSLKAAWANPLPRAFPRAEDLLENLAWCLIADGRYQECLELLNRATVDIKQHPGLEKFYWIAKRLTDGDVEAKELTQSVAKLLPSDGAVFSGVVDSQLALLKEEALD